MSAAAAQSDPVLEVLKGARALLTPEGAWCQEDFARTAKGGLAQPESPAAQAWCVQGAVLRVGESMFATKRLANPTIIAAEILLAHALTEQPGAFHNYVTWQDRVDRTHADVLRLLDTAIAIRGVQP